jgi:hypothetical protein
MAIAWTDDTIPIPSTKDERSFHVYRVSALGDVLVGKHPTHESACRDIAERRARDERARLGRRTYAVETRVTTTTKRQEF